MEDKKRAIKTGFNPHDGDVFYQCPYCKVAFGGWSIFFQKQRGEKTHCPGCNKPLIIGDEDEEDIH